MWRERKLTNIVTETEKWQERDALLILSLLGARGTYIHQILLVK